MTYIPTHTHTHTYTYIVLSTFAVARSLSVLSGFFLFHFSETFFLRCMAAALDLDPDFFHSSFSVYGEKRKDAGCSISYTISMI